jgi:hypothetical protein
MENNGISIGLVVLEKITGYQNILIFSQPSVVKCLFETEGFKNIMKEKDLFISTSCEVTAAAIRWKSGFGDVWKLMEDGVMFTDISLKYPLFQISIGEEWMDVQHIVTVFDNHLIQSYYNKYTVQSTPNTPKYSQIDKSF